MKEDQEKK